MKIPFKNKESYAPEILTSTLIDDILYMIINVGFDNYLVFPDVSKGTYTKIQIPGKGIDEFKSLHPYKDQFLTISIKVARISNITLINPKTGQLTFLKTIKVPSKYWPHFFIDVAEIDSAPYFDESGGTI